MDYYLNEDNFFNRLKNEYKIYGKLIIAYDFDDTVYDYHKKGRHYNDVINLLKAWRKKAYFICFTSCSEDKYNVIRNYLTSCQIPCDSINENNPQISFNGRKIYYNVLLDDRAGLKMAYDALKKLSEEF